MQIFALYRIYINFKIEITYGLLYLLPTLNCNV
jgi:hypothetical protein